MKRRTFISTTAAGAAGLCTNLPVRASRRIAYGHGDFRYVHHNRWGLLDPAKTPVNDCHGIVCTADNHIVLLTNDVTNNVIIYDTAGKLANKWGTEFPGAHGLSLVREGDKEVLFITDLKRNAVFKTSLDGEILNTWEAVVQEPQYAKAQQYRPSWTLHFPDGGFVVLDGYGKDYFLHYDADGKFQKFTGGKEGGIVHWGPHGGTTAPDGKTMLIAMSDQQYMLRIDRDGKILDQYDMPGGNPRSLTMHDGHYYVAHLADNWPADRKSRGFVSILDKDMKVVANVGGTEPRYEDGKLQKMKTQWPLFQHPHDICVDQQNNLYVAQFNSGRTYPIKLERV